MLSSKRRVPWWPFALLGFVGLSLLALLVLPVVVEWREDRAEREIRQVEPARRHISRLQVALAREALNERGYLLTGDDVYLRRIERMVEDQNRAIAGLRDLVSELPPEADSALSTLESSLETWHATRRQVLTELTPPERAEVFPRLASLFSGSLTAADALMAVIERAQADRRAEFRARERLWMIAGSSLALLTLVSVGVLAWFGRYLHQLSGRLQRAVDARDDVLAMVSHDLRSPLQTVSAGCHMLTQQLEGEEPRRIVDSMDAAVDEMAVLVEDLLDAEMIVRGRLTLNRKTVEVAPFLEEVVRATDLSVAAEDLELRLDVPEGVPAIHADPDRLKRVFFNLISNAARVTDAAGTISIEAAGADPGMVRFTVTDTGPGISEEAGELFERSSKDDAARGQYGLGLAIARGIVEAHGGGIWAESEPGVGAVFSFTIPRVGPASG